VTIDANLQWQQKLENLEFVVVVVRAVSNRLEDLIPMIPQMIAAIEDGEGAIRCVG
jgi:hypothetical protein